MTVNRTVAVIVAVGLGAVGRPLTAQQWEGARCDLNTKHYLVNSGVLYLKSATETKFVDKRAKDLKDADKVLHEALATGGQEKNPAAWYYLARYYALQNDLAGADSAFTKALALAPTCKDDIDRWRRIFWVPVFNEGVKAWQAGNTDSAIASFRRANAIYSGEPTGFIYLGTLFAGREAPDASLRKRDSPKYRTDSIVFATRADSSAKYFKLAVPAASDPKFAKEKRDALFNVARVYHAAQRWDGAVPGYKDYLAAYPNDVQAMAGLAAVYSQQGKRDEAGALYNQILDHADSAEATDLSAAAQAVINAIPNEPDTVPVGSKCRSDKRAKNKTLTVRQIATQCAAVTDDTIKAFRASITPRYRLAARAYEAGLAKDPYYREALYNLTGVYYLVGDTTKVLPLAQRLVAVDPLNRTSLAKLAGAWQIRGNKDSTLRYLTIADSMTTEVTVGTFTPDEQGAMMGGLVTHLKTKTSTPTAVTNECVNA